jgi:hypothetical protein
MDTHLCCKCMFQVVQLFQTDVVTILFGCCKVDLNVPCVTMASYVCCKIMFQMFHLFSNVCCKCFSLDVAKLVPNVAKVHLLFKFSRVREQQSERNYVRAWKGLGGTVPQGPRARATGEWGRADLPRVRADGAVQGAVSRRPGARRSDTTMY